MNGSHYTIIILVSAMVFAASGLPGAASVILALLVAGFIGILQDKKDKD